MRRLTGTTILTLLAAFLAGLPSPAAASSDDRVRTDDGLLQGSVTAKNRHFQAIPYAAAPTGALRWRSPRPPVPWPGVRDATKAGQPCAQIGAEGPNQPLHFIGSEDCLFLNVTTPRTTRKSLPVLVFLHGGGLVNGSGSAYNSDRIAQRDTIVVTLNYRLGALGFLRHPALSDPYAGNFGTADQAAALRWVRHNIAAFGGNAHNVTVSGESAGAFSVCALLAAPPAHGLFDKAIVASGPCANPFTDRRTADRHGRVFADEVGCADQTSACLRRVPAKELMRQSDIDQVYGQLHRRTADVPWTPVTGTAFLPLQPLQALRLGASANVPIMHGGTKDEMRGHVATVYDSQSGPVTAAGYPAAVRAVFGSDADRVLAAYPAGKYPSPSLALATLLTDYGKYVGACSQLPAIDAMRSPVFAYEYAQSSGEHVGDFPLGAYHGADIGYLFDGNFPGTQPPNWTPEERAFAGRLTGYWTEFARTGRPWPAYQKGSATVLSIAMAHTGPVNIAQTHNCGFWRTIS
ncbi:carboxylesterase/lipase family protein [Fodinicola acaciae]|uniref:carboxylesterase/lipase family protein n=1 Tax=Fodinicola acaciae TaxID=2681555 RepID=UPI0013D20E5A|nr:carboxylesterase family protein [Fodinicola acaciae]